MRESGGHQALTPREREIVSLALEGLTCREIAERLVLSPNTVKTHLRHVYEKQAVRNRLQLARLVFGQG